LKREEKLEQLLLKEKEGLEMRWVDGVTFSSKSPFTQHLMRPLSGLLYSMTGKEKASSLRKGTGLNKRENGSLRRFRQTVFARENGKAIPRDFDELETSLFHFYLRENVFCARRLESRFSLSLSIHNPLPLRAPLAFLLAPL
jgi:hypothetical protein